MTYGYVHNCICNYNFIFLQFLCFNEDEYNIQSFPT